MALEKQIIKGSLAADTTYDYKPREFKKGANGVAKNYVGEEAFRNDFKLSELIARQTGIAQLESEALQERINNNVLEKVKEVQEKAYQEGYQIGLSDGTEKAFQEAQTSLLEKAASLEALLKRVEDLRGQLLIDNESDLVTLVYQVARRIALRDLEENREAVGEALHDVLTGIKADEKVVVRLAQADLDFLQSVEQKTGKNMESLERVKFVIDAAIQPGGCVIESEFGSVDATVEERVDRVWTALAEKIPQKSNKE